MFSGAGEPGERPALPTPGRRDQCPLLVKCWPGHRGLNHILIVIDLGKCKAWQRPAIDPRAGRVALRIRLHSLLGCRARDMQLGAKRVLMWLDAIQKMSSFCCAIVLHQSHWHRHPPHPHFPSTNHRRLTADVSLCQVQRALSGWHCSTRSLLFCRSSHSFISVLHPVCLRTSVWTICPQRRVRMRLRLHLLLPPLRWKQECLLSRWQERKISDSHCSGDILFLFPFFLDNFFSFQTGPILSAVIVYHHNDSDL